MRLFIISWLVLEVVYHSVIGSWGCLSFRDWLLRLFIILWLVLEVVYHFVIGSWGCLSFCDWFLRLFIISWLVLEVVNHFVIGSWEFLFTFFRPIQENEAEVALTIDCWEMKTITRLLGAIRCWNIMYSFVTFFFTEVFGTDCVQGHVQHFV